MGQSALIAANGTDRLINIMSLLISFALRKKRFARICWSDLLTLPEGGGGGRLLFVLQLNLNVIDCSRKRNGLRQMFII